MSQFWWGDEDQQKHMHWFSWWKMCIPKKQGGMGFCDLESFNLAMLSKQCWRLLSEPDSLCAQVLRAKYFPSGNRASGRASKPSKGVISGEWVMARTLIYGVTVGSQAVQIRR
jgi:hypothetical protein